MRLNVEEWGEFLIKDIFKVSYGNKLDKNKMSFDSPTVNFVSRTGVGNGVDVIVDEIDGLKPYEKGAITIALGGSLGSTFVQTKPFYTGQNVAVLTDKGGISVETKLFITKVIEFESSVKYFPFGRELNRYIKTTFNIKLPIVYEIDYNGNRIPKIDETKEYSEQGYIPDFEYMENYIKSLKHKPLTTANKKGASKVGLGVDRWREFFINRSKLHGGLFDIHSCSCGNAGGLDDGEDINYIGAKKNDNGVMRRVQKVDSLVSKGNGIIFICDGEGSVGYTNYMDGDFIGSTTISVGYDENLNKLVGLFMVSLLDKEKFKFSYGRKYRVHLDEIQIKLPICYETDGVTPKIDETKEYSKEGYIPDFEFMENYIKSLPYGDKLV